MVAYTSVAAEDMSAVVEVRIYLKLKPQHLITA